MNKIKKIKYFLIISLLLLFIICFTLVSEAEIQDLKPKQSYILDNQEQFLYSLNSNKDDLNKLIKMLYVKPKTHKDGIEGYNGLSLKPELAKKYQHFYDNFFSKKEYNFIYNNVTKKLYLKIEYGCKKIDFSSYDSKEAAVVSSMFVRDHKELFFLQGSFKLTRSETITEYKFSIHYDVFGYYLNNEEINKDLLKKDLYEFLSKINYLCYKVNKLPDDFKIQYFHDWIVTNNIYNNDAIELNESDPNYEKNLLSHSPISALLPNYSPVCEGYAELLNILLNLVEIDNIYITGLANGGPHAWNYVKIDGKYYFIDCTWDDHVGIDNRYASYDYFLIINSGKHNIELFSDFTPEHYKLINISYVKDLINNNKPSTDFFKNQSPLLMHTLKNNLIINEFFLDKEEIKLFENSFQNKKYFDNNLDIIIFDIKNGDKLPDTTYNNTLLEKGEYIWFIRSKKENNRLKFSSSILSGYINVKSDYNIKSTNNISININLPYNYDKFIKYEFNEFDKIILNNIPYRWFYIKDKKEYEISSEYDFSSKEYLIKTKSLNEILNDENLVINDNILQIKDNNIKDIKDYLSKLPLEEYEIKDISYDKNTNKLSFKIKSKFLNNFISIKNLEIGNKEESKIKNILNKYKKVFIYAGASLGGLILLAVMVKIIKKSRRNKNNNGDYY